ncbi:flagellar hook-associated protein FlgK [Sphingomonas hengshuiensis]|uniref:Flagellar hook-associated protein 1 n=1 Tax=Sphingomonas hengshuiensis TaxID=1609977 RepID=A0A7U4J8J0_9SPHN|nr:flagellar basal body rod C-terminal domain-containing protein [Sphingomonas hengshuiensis]AJP72228.1 flagellar hook protein FlgK [Sphingomonas hengshuiensis]
MSLSQVLGSAVSGLAAAQAGLRSVSNNIANVGVSGYARERVSLTTAVTSGHVNGVVVGEPTRVADRFLEATVYRRAGDHGRAEVTANYLDRLQSLLGEPGAASGLPARLDAISASAVAMTGSQSTSQTAAAFTADVQDAITSMQQLDSDVEGLRGDVESEVGYSVDKINTLLSRIHDLNGAVSAAVGQGRSAGGSADQRMSAIEELSSLVSVTVREQPDGRVSIDTASGQVLLDKRLRQLSYPIGGQGTSQPIYPNIEVRFANDDGTPGASTGEALESSAVGGKLGGLLDLRDRALPAFSEKLGVLFSGLAETLNAVSNAGTTVPAPASLKGRNTGLAGSDRLGFTGAATFAVTAANGTLVAKTSVDFSALPATATVDDMVTAINSGLGGAATASFANGALTLTATGSGNGVVVAQDATTPSARAGVGVSQYFGLNDLVRSDASSLVPSGFASSDPHGFAAGETTQIVLRDTTGRALTSYTLTAAAGGSFGDLADDLNASPLGNFGTFALDSRGRMGFTAAATVAGATLSIPSDSTDRQGTGRNFSALMGLSGAASGLSTGEVDPTMLNDPARLPLARLQESAAVGAKALGTGDVRGATAFVDQLATAVDLGKDGVTTVERFSATLLGRTGLEAAQAQSKLDDAGARRDDAVNRRDSFSGVNIDEELAQMVVLQNSYSAAARVITTATEMYDTLLNMIR